MIAVPFDSTIFRMMKEDSDFACDIFHDCLDESPEVFLDKFRRYVQFAFRVDEVAELANMSREATYLTVAGPHADPGFSAVAAILQATGLRIRLEPVPAVTPPDEDSELSISWVDDRNA